LRREIAYARLHHPPMAPGPPALQSALVPPTEREGAMDHEIDDELFDDDLDFTATGKLEFDELDEFDEDASVELQLLAARVQATRNLGV
jgi:hypothetical protein